MREAEDPIGTNSENLLMKKKPKRRSKKSEGQPAGRSCELMTSQSCGPTRPTPAELTLARALIQRAKAADSRIRNADELMVCSAIACHAGECKGNPTRCAALMGKTISKPKLVRDWIERIEKLGPLPASPPPLCTPALLPPPAPQPTAPSPAELAEEERRRAAERQADCQAAYMKRKREVPKRDWNALSGQQRAAAGTFGFTEETWPLRFDATWWYAIDFPPAWAAPGIRVPPWLRRWGKLTEVELAAANALGYNRKQWQAEEHPEGLLRCDTDDSESGSDLDEVPACAGPTYEELLGKLASQIQKVEKHIPEYESANRGTRASTMPFANSCQRRRSMTGSMVDPPRFFRRRSRSLLVLL